jgi:protoporphyrinogen/coproporphyrinogen III oxidase
VKIIVIGGGITGLACAYRLHREHDVTLLEASNRVGGNIVTERRDGFVVDGGPDSWVASKPHATQLVKDLGLGDQIIGTRPETRRVYVAHKGKLRPLPEGLVLGIPSRVMPMVTTSLFSPLAKLRMGIEPLIARRKSNDDESVESFFVRRLGKEAADRLAGPLLGGIFAGDPAKLSVRAAFPQLIEWENKYGSLVKAMRAANKQAHAANRGGPPKSAFVTLRDGIATLPEALGTALGDRIRLKSPVKAISHDKNWRVEADRVVLAAPQRSLPSIVRALDPELATEVEQIRIGSSATVFLAFKREQISHALDAVGFIVPRSEETRVIAGTWVSSKWPHRAPEGHALIRAFFGGIGHEEILTKSDDELTSIAREELPKLMGPIDGAPLFSRVFRWTKASPQPEVGHLDRMKRVHARLDAHAGLFLAGNGYDGNGIPDCIKQGEQAAKNATQNSAGSV